jgi:hypothetical protein
MSKYKVGDKVRIVSKSGKNQMYFFLDIGDICTVDGFPEEKDLGGYDKLCDTPYLTLVRECDKLNQIVPENCVELLEESKEMVHHPSHYQLHKHECIEEMIHLFGIEAVIGFCKCNIHKYRYRAAGKDGERDLHKADEYMDILVDLEKRV